MNVRVLRRIRKMDQLRNTKNPIAVIRTFLLRPQKYKSVKVIETNKGKDCLLKELETLLSRILELEKSVFDEIMLLKGTDEGREAR